jgi:hypothetical protein
LAGMPNLFFLTGEAEAIMTQLQIKTFLEKAENITKKATSSRVAARKFLAKGGFCTKAGKLKKEYREE